MTLITRLNTAFTDTTLPILQRDPVLPNEGGVLLFEPKNIGTYPSQESNVSAQTLSSLTLTPRDVPVGAGTYDPATGEWSASATFAPNPADLYQDNTHAYCLSIWVDVPETHPGYSILMWGGDRGNLNAVDNKSLTMHWGDTDSRSFIIYKPDINSGNERQNGFINTLPVGVNRVGYAWQKNDVNGTPTWQWKGIVNNGTPGGWNNDTFGTGAAGINTASSSNVLWTNDGNSSIYRFYLENLTLSGRTPEQVWDADWARGNGRYS